ncbi:MAG: membrane lipoprotein lipid attachment site-containing protein [Solobacterium sp.]|nr:membrane lipoprotein lipid attachment site-containing protein [Solobacterium sp.]
MKKLLILAVSAMMLAGCSGKKEETAPDLKPIDPVPAETEETTPEPTSETLSEVLTNPKPMPDDLLEYLDGGWLLRTNDADTNWNVGMTIDAAAGTIEFLNMNDEYIRGNISVMDTYPDLAATTKDALRIEATSASKNYTDQYGDSMIIYSSDMQIITGSYYGGDYLFMRELGNGMSVLDSDMLGDKCMTGDNGWVFTRDTYDPFPNDKENEQLKLKDGTYYAYCWLNDGKGYVLQEMDAYPTTENWYGEELNTLRIAYTDSEFSNIPVLYNSDVIPNVIKPGLVKITVDENGTVTDIKDIKYMGYGAYDGE